MTIYASLSAAQQAQAAWLFADELMGTNQHEYEYELMGETVIGRVRIDGNSDGVHARKPHAIAVNIAVRDAIVTVEMKRDAEFTIKELARKISARLIQSQPVEA